MTHRSALIHRFAARTALYAVFFFALSFLAFAQTGTTIQIKAVVTEASLPTLADRQMCFCRDTKRTWIGTSSGNVLFAVPVSIQGSGTALPLENTVNFTGSGVSVTDDPSNGRTIVTISGGGGGGGGSGTVTSVGLSAPVSIFSLTGSPITTSGTLSLTLLTQSPGTVWAGPRSDLTSTPGTPTFRALVGADLPGATGSSLGAIQLVGDLGNTATAPKVIGLQGRSVDPTTPTTGQYLGWNGTAWAPATFSTGGSTYYFASGNNPSSIFNGTTPGVLIGMQVGTSTDPYLWFLDGTPANQAALYARSGTIRSTVQMQPYTLRPQIAYYSTDGTQGTSTTTGGLTFKDGLYVSGSAPTGTTATVAGFTFSNGLYQSYTAPSVVEPRATITTSGTLAVPASNYVRIILQPVDASGGNITLTLPSATTINGSYPNVVYTLKRADSSSNTVNIVAGSGDTLDYGSPTITLSSQNQSYEIIDYDTHKFLIR